MTMKGKIFAEQYVEVFATQQSSWNVKLKISDNENLDTFDFLLGNFDKQSEAEKFADSYRYILDTYIVKYKFM